MKDPETTITQAKLDNATIVMYDDCSKSRDRYPDWLHLGEGVIYAIDGVRQEGINRYHFFLKKRALKSHFVPKMIDQDKEYGDTAYPIVFITGDAKTVDVYRDTIVNHFESDRTANRGKRKESWLFWRHLLIERDAMGHWSFYWKPVW
jgi:hypothetical protein